MIGRVRAPTQQSLLNRAVYQFHRAVVLEQHTGGDIGDGRIELGRYALNALQELILLVTKTAMFRYRVAELKKLAQLKAKFGQLPELLNTDVAVGRGMIAGIAAGMRR